MSANSSSGTFVSVRVKIYIYVKLTLNQVRRIQHAVFPRNQPISQLIMKRGSQV